MVFIILIMKVDCFCVRLFVVFMWLNSWLIRLIWVWVVGIKLLVCVRMVISVFWCRKVDLFVMFGLVSS